MKGNDRLSTAETPAYKPRRKYNKEEFRRRLRNYEQTWIQHLASMSDEQRKIEAERWISLKDGLAPTQNDSVSSTPKNG